MNNDVNNWYAKFSSTTNHLKSQNLSILNFEILKCSPLKGKSHMQKRHSSCNKMIPRWATSTSVSLYSYTMRLCNSYFTLQTKPSGNNKLACRSHFIFCYTQLLFLPFCWELNFKAMGFDLFIYRSHQSLQVTLHQNKKCPWKKYTSSPRY